MLDWKVLTALWNISGEASREGQKQTWVCSHTHCSVCCRLSGCLLTEEVCASRLSVLRDKHSPLKTLDLTYNHLGDAGAKLPSAQLIGPVLKQDNLRDTRPGLWLMEDIKIHVKLMMHIYDFWLYLLSPPCFRLEPAGAQWCAEK